MLARKRFRAGVSGVLASVISLALMCATVLVATVVLSMPAIAFADDGDSDWNLPYDREWDNRILPGWESPVEHYYPTYGWDDSWPDDFDGNIETLDVSIVNQTPAEGVTGDVITLKKEYRDDEDYFWWYTGVNYGTATLEVSYRDPYGETKSYTFTVTVDSRCYELDYWYEDGSNQVLPGSTKQLEAYAVRHEENAPDSADGLSFEWYIVDGEEFATIEGNGENATLTINEYTGDELFWEEDVQVGVILKDDGVEVARLEHLWFTVSTVYIEIWPVRLDRLNLGQSITIEPELRGYAVEHEDTGGYVVLEAKDGFTCDSYNDNVLSVEDNGDGTFTITRKAAYPTNMALNCVWVNPEGEDVDIRTEQLYFSGLEYDMEFAGGDNWFVYNDGTLTLSVDAFGLEGIGYETKFTVGDISEGGWERTFTEGVEYDVNGNEITLYGDKLFAAGVDGVDVLAEAISDYGSLCDAHAWVSVREAYEDYEQQEDDSLLVGWYGYINPSYEVHAESSQFPDGTAPTSYDITDASISEQRPWEENEDGDVVELRKLDDGNGWEFEAVGYGEADITATYTDIHGNPKSWSFTVHVGRDVYRVDMWSEDGRWMALPGHSLTLHASGWHMSDEEVPEDEVLTYEWALDDGCDQWATLTPSPNDSQTATLTFKDMPENQEQIWETVGIRVNLFADGEECAETWRDAHVASNYAELSPLQIDEDLGVGESVTITPEIRIYNFTELGDDYESPENAEYEFDYDDGTLQVTDNGDGTFTIKRLEPDDFEFSLLGSWPGWGDYRNEIRNWYHLNYMGEWMFSDVDINTPHVGDILWLADRGITTGWTMDDGTIEFRGMNSVVRQDMAAFLYRMAGYPQYVPTQEDITKFKDVDVNTPHAYEIWWLASTGISAGWDMGDDTFEFRGMESVKRQDMAAFLRRLARYMGKNVDSGEVGNNPFRDVNQATPHYEDILWLASTGVTKGWDMGDGTFEYRGMNDVVRQDMAAFLHRLDTYIHTEIS